MDDSSFEAVTFAGHGGDEIRAHLWRPQQARGEDGAPAVVLAHEVFGLDAFVDGVARRFAEAGFVVLAPDLYSREGVPGPASTPEDPAPAWDVDTIRAAVASIPDRRAVGDLEAAAEWLANEGTVDGDRIAALGFCAGGNFAFLLGCQSRRVAAVVDYYGRIVYPGLSEEKPVQPLEMALNLSAPLLGIFAMEDPSIPPEDVDAMERTLDQFAKSFELLRVPGVGHGFANPLRPAWDAAAAGVAQDRTLAFLAEVLELEPL